MINLLDIVERVIEVLEVEAKMNPKKRYGGILVCTGGIVLFIAMIATIVIRGDEITNLLPFVLTAILGGVGVLAGILILKNNIGGAYIAIGCGVFNYVGNFIPIDSFTLTLSLSTLNIAALFMIIGGILAVTSKTTN